MNSRASISYFSQFLILIALIFGSFLLAGALAILIWTSMVNGNLLGMEKDMLNPANATAVKVVQLVSSMAMFLIPAFVFARIVNKQPAKHLGLKTKFSISQIGLVIAMVFAGFYLSGALAELTNLIPISAKAKATFEKMEKAYTDQVMIIANMKTFGEYLFSLIVIGLAPAIFEELIFRGALQQLMVKWTRSAWVGIIITSIIFSAIHFSYYGFLSRMFLGVVLGFLFYYSKSIWLSILAHFLNNGFAVTMMYVLSRQGKLSSAVMDERFPIWYGVAALAVIVALLIAYKNESKKLGTFYLDNTKTKDDNPFPDQPTMVL